MFPNVKIIVFCFCVLEMCKYACLKNYQSRGFSYAWALFFSQCLGPNY